MYEIYMSNVDWRTQIVWKCFQDGKIFGDVSAISKIKTPPLLERRGKTI